MQDCEWSVQNYVTVRNSLYSIIMNDENVDEHVSFTK